MEEMEQKDIINSYCFGRRVIKIPCSPEIIDENVIKRYLPKILSMHYQNVQDYKHLYDVYKGKGHIWDKVRIIDGKSNAIINENHFYSMVEFKKGYMFGDDVKYSLSDETMCSDDLKYLNKYMKDQKKSKKNVDIAENVYIAGCGNRLILPKQNTSFLNYERDSPFDIYNLSFYSSFVVYSSDFTGTKLFGGIITTLDSKIPDEKKYELIIYDKYHSYRYSCSGVPLGYGDIKFISKKRHYLMYCPIVEYKINKARLGIVEIVEPLLDAANNVSSYSVDDIIDHVNSILAVYNMELDKEGKDDVEKNKAISLITTDPTRPADAKYLVNSLNNADVNQRYETLVKVAYDIAGVPMATTQSTSGGDTGQARLLGGGWSRADIVAKQDEVCLKEAEEEMLEIILSICSKLPNCPIDDIYATDVDINFNRNKSDNILSKMQAIKYGYDMNMPKEALLNIVGITANSHEVAHAWEDNVISKNEQEKVDEKEIKESNLDN